MTGTELAQAIRDTKTQAALEVYIETPDGHQLVTQVMAVRYNNSGPFVLVLSS
jgi:hypothetical protein